MAEKRYISKFSLKKNKLLVFFVLFIVGLVLLLISNYLKEKGNDSISVFIDFITGAFSISTIALTIITIISDYFDAKSNRICYLSNDSSFSYSIFSGISNSKETEDYFITSDMKCKDKDVEYLIKFFRNKAYDYSGVIVRFKFDDNDHNNKRVFENIKNYINDGNKVVFADTGGSSIKLNKKDYVVVNSNLRGGGEIIGKEMKKVIKDDSLVICIDGPQEDLNLHERIIGRDSILKDIKNKYTIDNSDKLNKSNMFKYLEKFFNEHLGELTSNKKSSKLEKYHSIVIFCGNDQNAFDLMSTLLKNKEKTYQEVIKYFKEICGETYDNLYIFGYDGLRKGYTISKDNDDIQYKLDEFTDEFNYYSINSDPIKIGENAVKELVHLMKYNRATEDDNYSSLGITPFHSKIWRK